MKNHFLPLGITKNQQLGTSKIYFNLILSGMSIQVVGKQKIPVHKIKQNEVFLLLLTILNISPSSPSRFCILLHVTSQTLVKPLVTTIDKESMQGNVNTYHWISKSKSRNTSTSVHHGTDHISLKSHKIKIGFPEPTEWI